MRTQKIHIPQVSPYIIYRIRVVGTRYYYIGVTKNFSLRRHQHLLSVASAMTTIKFNKALSSSKFYIIAAEMLSHTTTKEQFCREHFYEHASNNLTFKKVKSCDTVEEAKEIECMYIKDSLYCLNLQKTSYYAERG